MRLAINGHDINVYARPDNPDFPPMVLLALIGTIEHLAGTGPITAHVFIEASAEEVRALVDHTFKMTNDHG